MHAPGFGQCSCCKQRRALWRVGERWLCKRCKSNECECDCTTCPEDGHHWILVAAQDVEPTDNPELVHEAQASGYAEWLQCCHCPEWTAADADLDAHAEDGGL